MRTSIIVLNWNTLDYLKKCIGSIKKYTRDCEIIIVDNGSTEAGTRDYISGVADKAVFNEKNLGFARGNNIGARQADGEFLCFMNSDVAVGENWLEDMHEIFSRDKQCGAVGPLANPVSGVVNGQIFRYPQYRGMFLEDTKVSNLIGFCILMKRDLFEKIGGWDEDFETGNYEDNYLSEMIRREGCNLWVSAYADVIHTPGRTFDKNKIDYIGTLERNRQLFIKKIKMPR